MRLLLDECVPKRLARELAPHRVRTVTQVGWSGLRNGALLARAERHFDVFVTVDGSIPFQHDVSRLGLAIAVLEAQSNDIDDLRPLMLRLRSLLTTLRPGECVHVRPD